MLTAILISVFFIIFPLFINVNAVYISELKTVFFRIDLFGIIKVLYGKIYLNLREIVIEYNNKQKVIKITKDTLDKNNIKKLSGYHVKSISSLIELGGERASLILGSTLAINFINSIAFNILANKKSYLKIDSNLNLYLNKNVFNHYIKAQIIINILTLIINLIKNIIRNIKDDKK